MEPETKHIVFIKKSSFKIACILLISSIILPILLLYGNIDDFIFQHVGFAEKTDILGYMPDTDPIFYNQSPSIPGWYVFVVEFSKISNISYDVIPFLPIQLITFYLLLFLIFLKICNNKILCSLIILIIATFSQTLYFPLHELGEVLFFLIILSIILLYKSKDVNSKIAFFLIIFFSIISMNFISYKATLFSILFILGFLFLEYFEYYFLKSNCTLKLNQNLRKTLFNIFLLGTIIIFTFNKVVYNAIIPVMKLKDESIMGIYKISLMFQKNLSDPLGIHGLYYSPPIILSYIKVVRLVLLGILILICVIYIVQTFIKNKKNQT